jgi:hypothetical protein
VWLLRLRTCALCRVIRYRIDDGGWDLGEIAHTGHLHYPVEIVAEDVETPRHPMLSCRAEAASNGLFGRRQCIADRLTVPSLRREFLLSAGEVVAGDLMHRLGANQCHGHPHVAGEEIKQM